MKSKSETETVERKKRLARILRVPGNKVCADCPEPRPTWISFVKPQQNFALGSKVLASFVCLECAGLHRKLGTHICVVRSIRHDQFEDKDVDCAEHSGNDVVNEIFEGHLQKSTMDGIHIKPLLGAEVARRERFIRQKYVDLYFYRKRVHYQHIASVNKVISNSRRQQQHANSQSHSKSPGGGSRSKSNSPSKPFRKKLSLFLHNNDESNHHRDSFSDTKNATKMTTASSGGCSTTVGNTTMTPGSSTSRTRTVTERDDSTKSGSRKMGGNHRDHRDDSHKSGDSKKKGDKTSSSSKKRSSKNGTTSTRRKKGQKKSSSQRRLKSNKKKNNNNHLTIDPMFDAVPSNATRIGEMSVPILPQQPNSKSPTNHNNTTIGTTVKRTSRESDDLSGMILVFDEESSCPSLESESIMRRRESRRSSRELDRHGRSSSNANTNTNTNTNTTHSVGGSSGNHQNLPTVVRDDAPNPSKTNTNNQHQNNNDNDKDPSNNDFHRKLPMNSTSESCIVHNSTSRDNPLAMQATSTLARDARRSRSEITIDEITKKHHRDGSTSPGHVGKQIFSRNFGMHHQSNNNSDNNYNYNNKIGSTSLLRLDVKMPLQQQGDTSLLREHLKKETRASTSARNLRIPYLDSSPLSPLSPMSIEGFVSEGTSYGFGDNTVNNMSGTGSEHNHRSSVVEDTSHCTENGFRLIDITTTTTTTTTPKTTGSGSGTSDHSDSGSCKGFSWETTNGSSFARPFQNKKASDGAMKNQSGRRSCNPTIVLDIEEDIVAALDPADTDTPNEIDTPMRSLVHHKSKSKRSLLNNSKRSLLNISKRSIVDKSDRSLVNKSKRSIAGNKSNNSLNNESNRSLVNNSKRSLLKNSKKSVINKSNRSIGNKSNSSFSNESNRSLVNKSKRSILKNSKKSVINKSNRSIGNKSNNILSNESNRSLVNKSNKSSSSLLSHKFDMSITIDEPVIPIQHPGLSTNEAHGAPCDSPPPSKKKKKKKRRKSKKSSSESGKKLSLRNQALFEEWNRLKSENQNKFADFNRTFSQHVHA